MGKVSKSLLIGVPFVLVYFIIRNLPVEPCDFLHEETYNEEGVLDYCGPGDSDFVDLTTRKWPLKLKFRPLDELKTGRDIRFEIDLRQFDGSPLKAEDIALSHTKKIHLLAVHQSLSDYQHIHPEPDSLYDGLWKFSMTPKYSGKYSVFLDFIPVRSPRRVILSTSFNVTGNETHEQRLQTSTYKLDGSSFKLGYDKSEDGDKFELTLSVTDDQNKSQILEPVMGAFAHMVAFDEKLKGFAHLHPNENTTPITKDASHTGALTFTFVPPSKGRFRLWAQCKLAQNKSEIFVPFDIEI